MVGLVIRKLQQICGVPIEVLFQDVGVVLENRTPAVSGVFLRSGPWRILDVIENAHMVVVRTAEDSWSSERSMGAWGFCEP